jgi:hypothetical protein
VPALVPSCVIGHLRFEGKQKACEPRRKVVRDDRFFLRCRQSKASFCRAGLVLNPSSTRPTMNPLSSSITAPLRRPAPPPKARKPHLIRVVLARPTLAIAGGALPIQGPGPHFILPKVHRRLPPPPHAQPAPLPEPERHRTHTRVLQTCDRRGHNVIVRTICQAGDPAL